MCFDIGVETYVQSQCQKQWQETKSECTLSLELFNTRLDKTIELDIIIYKRQAHSMMGNSQMMTMLLIFFTTQLSRFVQKIYVSVLIARGNGKNYIESLNSQGYIRHIHNANPRFKLCKGREQQLLLKHSNDAIVFERHNLNAEGSLLGVHFESACQSITA